jgi:hypothetical protein
MIISLFLLPHPLPRLLVDTKLNVVSNFPLTAVLVPSEPETWLYILVRWELPCRRH